MTPNRVIGPVLPFAFISKAATIRSVSAKAKALTPSSEDIGIRPIPLRCPEAPIRKASVVKKSCSRG